MYKPEKVSVGMPTGMVTDGELEGTGKYDRITILLDTFRTCECELSTYLGES